MLQFIKDYGDEIFVVSLLIMLYAGMRFLIQSTIIDNKKSNNEGFESITFGTPSTNPDANMTTAQQKKCADWRSLCSIERRGNCNKTCQEIIDEDMKEGFDNKDKHLAKHIISPKFKSYQHSYDLDYSNVLNYAEMRHSQKINAISGCNKTTFNTNPVIEGFQTQTINCKKGGVLDGSHSGNAELTEASDKQQQSMMQTYCQAQEDATFDKDVSYTST